MEAEALAVVEDLALEDLRRGVHGGTDLGRLHVAQGLPVVVIEALGEAEVNELEAGLRGVAGEDDVCGLQIAVDDDGVEAVEVLKGAEDVQRPAMNLTRGR